MIRTHWKRATSIAVMVMVAGSQASAQDETQTNEAVEEPVDQASVAAPAMYTEQQLEERIRRVVREMQDEESVATKGVNASFNPAISANMIVVAGGTTRDIATDFEETGDFETGLTLQEVEVRLSAVVDPYFRADLTLSGNLEEVGFEEAFLTTLALPSVALRAGQMFASFGKHNLLHTHTYPFLSGPLAHRALLGAEGIRDVGVSADVLLPLPFFVEINAQVFRGEWATLEGSIADDPTTPVDETVDDKRRSSDLAYLGHLRALWDLSDATTFELGASYFGGRNGFGKWGSVYGADLTLKWRPLSAQRYKSVEWQTEYLSEHRQGVPGADRLSGGHTQLRVQFAQRWWVQARIASLGLFENHTPTTWRTEVLGGFIPSEFSAIRLQYAIEDDASDDLVHEVFLQAIVSIGSHPAHGY